ncbi:Lipopolysaccharide export system permease protein LptG [Patescibacteria group bacterium]|nr:Lipopolysaccharide export system permease protein LptG [Patescibacteria group bacterium]
MNVLTSYIVREILKGSLIAITLLLTLFNLFTFSDELSDLGKGNYDLPQIFKYLALTSPTVFYELMPASALLGSLFVLGAMANNQELIAMRSAGLSVFGIIRAVLTAGVVLVCIAIFVGEFIAPDYQKDAQLLKAKLDSKQVMLNDLYGLWLRENKSFINVRTILDNGDLADISIYDVDDSQHLYKTTHAEKAIFLGNKQWRLENIKQSLISTEQIRSANYEQQEWKSSIAPDLLNISVVNPNNLSLIDLAKYIDFLKTNHQKSQQFELAFWGRVVNPLVTFIMLLVSAPFVIGIKRGISAGGRMLIGVIIGMGFNIVDKIIGHLGLIYDLNPPLIAFMPSLLMLSASIYAIRRIH